jgi:Ser/Thr protein kinase RdoA (MazF antagonist)
VHLPAQDVVLRICASTDRERAIRELSIAHWLLDCGIPAVRASEDLVAPLRHREWVITIWEFVPGIHPATTSVIGTALHELHRVDAPDSLDLPALDPFDGIADYLDHAHLDHQAVSFLRERLDELRDAYTGLHFELRPGPVHGDAHRKNIMQDGNGRPVIFDLERFSVGPREWDLVVAAVYERVSWYTPAEYEAFVSTYGWDVRAWSGFETLAAVRELRMTAWLCARTGREPHLLPEAHRRIASLRDPSSQRDWTPGT